MPKIMRAVLVVFIVLALLIARKFGLLDAEQLLYLGKMAAGWFSWTVAISALYWALETLFPRVLCGSPTENSFARTEEN
jgi:hypothetical protein